METMSDELQGIRDYLANLGVSGVTVSGTYEAIRFVCADKYAAITVLQTLAGDVTFAGGVAVTEDGTVTVYGVCLLYTSPSPRD